jgi:preprotein translocase subunit SecF
MVKFKEWIAVSIATALLSIVVLTITVLKWGIKCKQR